ncbi:MAG: membrane protein insertion efficiency factor YidD [SAR324 cluster bacterium]|nr:membrane protein insertion efficiency factor YidD [SAR324 cluster bacterium]MCH8885690.1 membrane protein insertion efficiency factor YidD [SAR324 cluster bacterium]
MSAANSMRPSHSIFPASGLRRILFGLRISMPVAVLISVACWAFLSPSASAQMRRHPFPPHQGLANPMRAPGLTSGPRIPLGSRPRTGFHAVLSQPTEGGQRPLLLGLLAFYRVVVSPVNGSNSDLAPVHSLYAVQAVAAYGSLLGLVLITERLIHEPGEIPFAPAFTENGRVFHYDPLLWNVFWWQ